MERGDITKIASDGKNRTYDRRIVEEASKGITKFKEKTHIFGYKLIDD